MALLLYPDTVNMTYLVPFAPPMGGVFGGAYPFAGTGYTATTEARTVPEISQPPGARTRLPAGSQLVEVDPVGARILRGTLAQNGTWSAALPRAQTRAPLEQRARYKGVLINLTSTDGEFYWVGSFGTVLPDGFMLEMWHVGNLEYLGKVRVDDPGLSIESK